MNFSEKLLIDLVSSCIDELCFNIQLLEHECHKSTAINNLSISEIRDEKLRQEGYYECLKTMVSKLPFPIYEESKKIVDELANNINNLNKCV